MKSPLGVKKEVRSQPLNTLYSTSQRKSEKKEKQKTFLRRGNLFLDVGSHLWHEGLSESSGYDIQRR